MRVSVRDDRGTEHPVCQSADLPGAAPLIVRRALRLASRRYMLVVTLALVVGPSLLLAGLLLRAPTSTARPVMPFEQLALMTAAAVLVTLSLAWLDARVWHGPRARRVCLRHRVCPSCGYGLVELPPQDDGCVVCPECGGAWRLDHDG